MRKSFQCNGSIVKDKKNNEIILLQGNQGEKTISFMHDVQICTKDQIIRKGLLF